MSSKEKSIEEYIAENTNTLEALRKGDITSQIIMSRGEEDLSMAMIGTRRERIRLLMFMIPKLAGVLKLDEDTFKELVQMSFDAVNEAKRQHALVENAESEDGCFTA
jgi:hypothetical protein